MERKKEGEEGEGWGGGEELILRYWIRPGGSVCGQIVSSLARPSVTHLVFSSDRSKIPPGNHQEVFNQACFYSQDPSGRLLNRFKVGFLQKMRLCFRFLNAGLF